jgi:regulator of sirC expression with transglutaminase-like and TPR domain
MKFSQELINKKIKNLENSIATLRELNSNLHKQDISKKLVDELKKGDDSNLALCALLFAKYDNREIDIQAYQDEIERMVEELRIKIDKESDVESKVSLISKYLFEENGYHGSRNDYYNQSNSYLNEVLDDREGIPITLSIIYIELASRIGIKINGLGLPGHFAVFYMKNGDRKIIDPFNSGNPITNAEADNMVKDYDSTKNSKDYLASDNISIIQRMIYNLKSIAIDTKDFNKALSYVDLLIALDPEDPQERLSRSIIFIQLEESEKAKQDLEWLMNTKPDGIRIERIRELYNRLN